MGGRVPLGYEKDERTLRINEAEVETVRTLYALYRKHGTLRQVKAEADHLGLRTKQRLTADGTRTGRLPFRRGHLHCLLTNPLYAGRIRHQRRVYEGQHPSIIAPELWDAVQTQLQAGSAKPRRRTTKGRAARSPLAGKLFDETGDRLTPSHTKKKNGQRLRYLPDQLHVHERAAPTDPTLWFTHGISTPYCGSRLGRSVSWLMRFSIFVARSKGVTDSTPRAVRGSHCAT